MPHEIGLTRATVIELRLTTGSSLVRVTSADTVAAFKTGLYGLCVNMSAGTDPAFTSNSVARANGSPLTSGGGQALQLLPESSTNQTTADTQVTSERSITSSTSGNYVVTWSSLNSDGSGWDVYGQRYDANGLALGTEFHINTTSAGNQTASSVAMNGLNGFFVTWTSAGDESR